MKVLHVNISDKIGGAAIAAYRLNQALRQAGIDSQMLVCDKISTDHSVIDPGAAVDKALIKLAIHLDRLPLRFSHVDDTFRASLSAIASPLFARKINALEPDIVNLHWICDGVLRPEFLPRIKAPIVWTMHDPWPFCGSENYVLKSTRYIEGYRRGNRLHGSSGPDLDRWMYRRKQRAYAKANHITFVSPSRWLAEAAKKSALLRDREVVCIPNGIDPNLFRPLGKRMARQILGLPEDKQILLFGAVGGVADKRKGFHLLTAALQELGQYVPSSQVMLTTYGGGDELEGCPIFESHNYGRLRDDISVVLAYAAADVFVIPSLIDNLPNTVLESLACGTPVVGFDIGGMSDMVLHEQNGYLAAPYDTQDLCNGIHYVLEHAKANTQLAEHARNTVLDTFTLRHQAKAYIELYQSLLA